MEQIGDIVERVLQDVEDKKIRKGRSFSEAGMAEISHLHERLLSNLRLGMSVFLDGHVNDARRLLEEKARFRDLEHEYAANHIARLRDNTAQSIETSSLHLDLISELKRINSHICSIAYPILESRRRAGRHAAAPFAPGRTDGRRGAPVEMAPPEAPAARQPASMPAGPRRRGTVRRDCSSSLLGPLGGNASGPAEPVPRRPLARSGFMRRGRRFRIQAR